jgi:predicted ABC-type ATPase
MHHIRRHITRIILFIFSLSAHSVLGALIPLSVVNENLKTYSNEEISLIQEDLSNIRRLVFRGKKKSKHPYYLGTAGGPGASKSTILETILHEDPTITNVAYIDPDPQSLRLMINTYLTQSLSFYKISKEKTFEETQRNAYNYWRAGSNYIAQTLLNKAVEEKYNIAHGTTSTAPVIEKFYQTLKKQGYKIHLVLCYAPNEARGASIEHRVKTQSNYQSTPEDAIAKGKMFAERFPVYFKYADTLRLYWTCHFSTGSKEVARLEKGKLIIKDEAGYQMFVKQYEEDRAASQESLPTWEELLKAKEGV